jgi:hypothetical protein
MQGTGRRGTCAVVKLHLAEVLQIRSMRERASWVAARKSRVRQSPTTSAEAPKAALSRPTVRPSYAAGLVRGCKKAGCVAATLPCTEKYPGCAARPWLGGSQLAQSPRNAVTPQQTTHTQLTLVSYRLHAGGFIS